MKRTRLLAITFCLPLSIAAQDATLLKATRVFDGEAMHEGWSVLVKGDRIEAAGATVNAAGTHTIDLGNVTLLPGLVEGHSHILLHPYNETVWNDQVLKEGIALRPLAPSIICAPR